jgi:hypothetical protein
VLILGAVAALGAAEAIRESVRARFGNRRATTISFATSPESAPPLAALARSREAEKAHTWLSVDGYFGPESARALQVLLTRSGLNTGKIDGIFGTKTKRAMQEFLRGRGYDVGKIDGFFGPRSVMALQVWLRDSGFSPKGPKGGTIDGIWGPVTTRSLQQTLNMELGSSSPKRSGAASTAEASPKSAVPRRSSTAAVRDALEGKTVVKRGTLSSVGFIQGEELVSPKPRRTLSERRSKEIAAAGAA